MLTEILTIFLKKGVLAIQLITPFAKGLFGTILLLDFVWASIQNVLNKSENTFTMVCKKLISYSIYFYILANYKVVIDQILSSFIKVGLVAGGSGISEKDATDPSYIIDLGYTLMDKMYTFKNLVQGDTPPDVGVQGIVNSLIAASKGELTIAKLFPNLFFWLVSFLILIAFAAIAIQLFITWIETYFITSIALIFIPCAIFRPMAFLAEKAIGSVIGSGVKLMMLLFVLSVSFPILESWKISANPTDYECIKLLTSAAAVAFLCWQAPAMAASLMSGSPSLTAGSMLGGVAAGAALAGAAVSAASAGFSATKGLVNGVSSLANATQEVAGAATDTAAQGAMSTSASALGGGMANTGGSSPASSGSGGGGSAVGSGGGSGLNPASIASRLASPSASQAGTGSGMFMADGSWHSFGGGASGGADSLIASADSASENSFTPSIGTSSFAGQASSPGTSGQSSAAGSGTTLSADNIAARTESTAGSANQPTGSSTGMNVQNIAQRLQQSIPPEDKPTGGMDARIDRD